MLPHGQDASAGSHRQATGISKKTGILSRWLGWRAPYLIAAGLALVLAGILAKVLPDTRPLMFGAFSAAWTTVALPLTGLLYPAPG